MAGGDAVGKAAVDDAVDQILQREAGEVERLVGMKIQRQPGLGRDREEVFVGRGRIRFDVRAAADAVDSECDRVAQQRPLCRALGADARPTTQREHLDVDDIAQPLAHPQQCRDGGEAVRFGEIGMGANGGGTVGRDQQRGAFGAGLGVGLCDEGAIGLHRKDRTHQVAGRVGHHFREKGLVQVSVGFGHRRQQQPAGRVQHFVARLGRDAAGRHQTIDDAHRGRRAVGQQGIRDGERGEISHPRPSRLSLAGRWHPPRNRCDHA